MTEPTIADRISWTSPALDLFAAATFDGLTLTDALQNDNSRMGDGYSICMDMIANVLHIAHAQGWAANDILQAALGHFEFEQEKEADAVATCVRCANTDQDGSGACPDCGDQMA